MEPAAIFQIVNPMVLPGWALLLLAPGWRWTQRITAVLIPLLLACVYLVTVSIALSSGGEGNFNSLAGVAALFRNPMALLAGWIHYLAFDLFIGSWEVRDSRSRGISHWFVAPCLVLTFLLGPIGLLLYFAVRRSADVMAH
ncbi:MAG: ABA4-like family protein [Bryobacteraceae bacterium]